ncbi:excalibur calcium-binding domain-containing protein [Streptomyces sp. NPDC006529]|uniref:excalibur calcium-binding domain-containing protein n=1 Tax=Streptomyces sp. NPDC006529 TaxID=3157177 RepID=UPI0033B5D334
MGTPRRAVVTGCVPEPQARTAERLNGSGRRFRISGRVARHCLRGHAGHRTDTHPSAGRHVATPTGPPSPADPVTPAEPSPATTSAAPATEAPNAYYRRCADARAAGAAPLHRGEPGYRSELDRDGDGVACEPWR